MVIDQFPSVPIDRCVEFGYFVVIILLQFLLAIFLFPQIKTRKVQ